MSDTGDPIAELPAGGYPPGVVPHLAVPWRLDRSGRAAIVDQDTDAEVLQTIRVLLSTRPGERQAVPRYGVADPLFFDADEEPTLDELADAVAEWEPRATVELVDRAVDDLGGVGAVVGVAHGGR